MSVTNWKLLSIFHLNTSVIISMKMKKVGNISNIYGHLLLRMLFPFCFLITIVQQLGSYTSTRKEDWLLDCSEEETGREEQPLTSNDMNSA